MEQNETGCQSPPSPIRCANDCGFFGTKANMNMCSKCYKDVYLKQEQVKLAAASIQSMVNMSSNDSSDVAAVDETKAAVSSEVITASTQTSSASDKHEEIEQGPKRCSTCRKRVGFTGFKCRCGNTFCSVHRHYKDHECTFDYRGEGRETIAKANPVIKAEKLDKI